MNRVFIVGMGMSPDDLTSRHLKVIESAEILAGGERHLADFASHPAEKRRIDKDLKGLAAFIRENMDQKRVVVLASGDPLYYGVGRFLCRELGPDRVTVLPNVSAVSAAFSRINESWNDAEVVSLHGRDLEARVVEAALSGRKAAVFTDPKRSPAWLAGLFLKQGAGHVRMCVLEKLGYPDERVRWFSPEAAAVEAFADPNMVVLPEGGPAPVSGRAFLGMPEDWFVHTRGMITKPEVRAVALSKLRLFNDSVMWDLGAGSGSVGIEAARIAVNGAVTAVEKNERRAEQIRENVRRFNVPNVTVTTAELPEGLDNLPDPDRVFIGGGGGGLAGILERSAKRLRPEGVIVVNTVILENATTAAGTLEELGFNVEVVEVRVSVGRSMPGGRRMTARDPVFIISGKACF